MNKFILSTVSLLLLSTHVNAEVFCAKKTAKVSKKGAVPVAASLIVSSTTCPSGYVQLLDTSSFKGDKGDKGDQGNQGSAGAQGAQGVPGATGSQGLQGVQGSQGIQGVAGLINFGTCYSKDEVFQPTTQQFKSVGTFCDDSPNEFMLSRGFVIASGGGSQITHSSEQLSISNGVPIGTSIAFQSASSGTNYGVTLTLVCCSR